MTQNEDPYWVVAPRSAEGESVHAPDDGDRAVGPVVAHPTENPSWPESQPPAAGSQADAGYANFWLKTTTRAAAFAGGIDTPEAWQSVASSAEVLCEIAQALKVVAEAKQKARRLSMTAEATERGTQEAAREAAEAKQTAEQLVQIAEDAKRRAEEAAGEAVAAWQRAERAALAAVDAEHGTHDAAREAAEAEMFARQLEALIAEASEINSAAAWSEAQRRVSATWAARKQPGAPADPEVNSDPAAEDPFAW